MYIKAKDGEMKESTKDIYTWFDEDLVRNYIWYKMLYKMADAKMEKVYQNRYTICRLEMEKRGIHKDEYGNFYKNA